MRRFQKYYGTLFKSGIALILMQSLNTVASDRTSFFFPGIRPGQPRTTPGGILYPNFGRAGEVNAATIPWDFGRELELLYSPPKEAGEAHGVSASLTAAAASRIGLNVGYLGSLYEGAALHGGFAGLGARIHSLSAGVTVRAPTVDKLDSATVVDVSSVYKPSAVLDFGFVVRNLRAHPVAVAGVGIGRYGAFNLELNFAQPLFATLDSWMARYQVITAAALKFPLIEFGAVATYSKYPDGNSTNPMSYTAAGTIWIGKSLGVKFVYNSVPTSYTIGICLYDEPVMMNSRRGFVERRNVEVWQAP